MTPNIADIIRHHVGLEVRCIDLCVARTGSAANRPGVMEICRRSRGFPGVNVTWATRVEQPGGRDHRHKTHSDCILTANGVQDCVGVNRR